jgi:hypothetical protein
VTAADQANIIALLRSKLASSRSAVQALGDGDSQRDALSALASSEKAVNALEQSAPRRLAAGPMAIYAGKTGEEVWLQDAREVQSVIDSLPADAKQGTIEDVLAQTARATVTQTAQLAGNVAGAVGFVGGAFWSALPFWVKGAVVVVGVGALSFVGWQLYQLAKAPRRLAGAM